LSTEVNDSDLDAAERSAASVGFSETDFRSCSSTTSACSISYKYSVQHMHMHGIKSSPISNATELDIVTAVLAQMTKRMDSYT